ncbi:Neuronal acetylcholine receptor subunit alpha-9-I [Lamellibrachia satsuma]|nr:Neuronal acetylcholine receptor subunit alpha-9-I [Lamellibrachia satsuma]
MPKKTSHLLLFWYIVFGVILRPTTCYMKHLHDLLLGANYSRDIRPVRFENETIDVDIQLEVYIIREMNAKMQMLYANIWIEISWRDIFLQWSPAAFDGVEVLTVPSELLWRPDVIIFNSVDMERTATEVMPQTMATVKCNGHVYWSMPVLVKTSCKFKPANYPFDVQVCPLTFGSWSHNNKEVNVTSSYTATTYPGASTSENGEWKLTGIATRIVPRAKIQRSGDFPLLVFDVKLKRLPLYYVIHLLVPAVMLMVIGVLVFLVPSDSGEKVSLASTVLLSMTVF